MHVLQRRGYIHTAKCEKLRARGFSALLCRSEWAGRAVMSFPIAVRSNWVLLALKKQPVCQTTIMWASGTLFVSPCQGAGLLPHSKIWYQLRYFKIRQKCRGIQFKLNVPQRRCFRFQNSTRKLCWFFQHVIYTHYQKYLSSVVLLCVFFPQISFCCILGYDI